MIKRIIKNDFIFMNKKAFTLIEILVVITVLIILISMAIPRIQGMLDNANITKVKGELQTLQAAVESYYIFNHVYPNANGSSWIAQELVVQSPQIVSTDMYDFYFTAAPLDYAYLLSLDRRSYIIGSVGPSNDGTAWPGITWNNGLSQWMISNVNNPNYICVTNNRSFSATTTKYCP